MLSLAPNDLANVGQMDVAIASEVALEAVLRSVADTRLGNRIDAHSVSLAELAFADASMQTWLAAPYSQFLADYFVAQTWYSNAASTNVN